jgi:pimeloyl-ACP methyl ester carboxylesterase
MLYTTLLRRVFRTLFGPLPDPPPEGSESGLVLVADGVGGLDLCGTGLQHMVARAGLGHVVKVCPWGHGFGRWYRDLTNVENHAARSAALADEVRAFRERSPGRPVFLVGKSGGTGMVVRTLERLPEESVETAVLLAPAISPSYDLTRALRAVRRELVVFWSPLDVIVLGAGTGIFGTIDRVRGVSAGMVGFRVPEGLDDEGRAQYAKLRQVRWHPGMAKTFNLGGHVGPDNPAFLRKYVVPLLHTEESEAEHSAVAVASEGLAPAGEALGRSLQGGADQKL